MAGRFMSFSFRFASIRPLRSLCFVVVALAVTTLPVQAAKAPMSMQQLQSEADLIVEGEVTDLRVQPGPSRYESGFGNSDWLIDVTIDVDQISKGAHSDSQITARCFRIRSRRSSIEFLTPGGNDRIPEVGTAVRVYLERAEDRWHVLHPNGFESLSPQPLVEAPVIAALGSGYYTFGLPLEGWCMFLAVLLLASLFFWVRSLVRRHLHAGPDASLTAS
jgi:hypothetical protein